MNKYGISIYWSEDDQVFIAEVPELPGCMTHGETKAAALMNAEEAIQSWLDTAKEFGDPIPTPRGGRLASNSMADVKYRVRRSGYVSPTRRNNPFNFSARMPQNTVNPKAH